MEIVPKTSVKGYLKQISTESLSKQERALFDLLIPLFRSSDKNRPSTTKNTLAELEGLFGGLIKFENQFSGFPGR
jgi:hypothetical protein